jgi:hypothetical protein
MDDWRYINDSPAKFQTVTAADIQRVANTYFDWKNRSVAIYLRKEGTVETIDPELAALELQPQLQAQVLQMIEQLTVQEDPNALRMVIGQMEGNKDKIINQPNAPPGIDKAMDYVLKKLNERLAEVEKNAPATQPK